MTRAFAPKPRAPGPFDPAFTLIELMLVLTLLATILAVASPALARFLGGRGLTEEARRLVSLTRLARSEAVSRSQPMELWVEPSSGRYGLRGVEGYADAADKTWEFRTADGIQVEVDPSALDAGGLARITFHPDGTIAEDSAGTITLRNRRNSAVRVQQSDDGLDYILASQEPGS